MRMRQAWGAVLASMAMASVVLAGCGGAATTESASDGGAIQEEAAATETTTDEAADEATADEAAEDEKAAAAVPVVEEPALEADDFAGYYKLTGNEGAEKSGVFGIYRFKKDGTFQIISLAQDARSVRKGTFEIDGETVIINVPRGGSVEIDGTTYTAHEIKDGKVTFDGKTMTATGISSDGTITAEKISKKKYEQIVELAASLGPQKIAIGETVSTDDYSFTVTSLEFKEEIYPSDTSGYYRYYTDEEGKSYLVAEVTYTNNRDEYCLPGYGTAAMMTVAGSKYSADVEVDGGSQTLKSYRIEAKETCRVVIWASIPDAAREEIGEVKLYWSFPRDCSLLNNYYSSENDNVMYVFTL